MESEKISKILGIQTSTLIWSVAIIDGEKILGEYVFDSCERLSKILLPSIDELIKKLGITKDNLGGIAVAKGPGLFTGSRTGIAVAKGLALGLGIPVVGMSVLDALAFNLSNSNLPICPLISSRGKPARPDVTSGQTGGDVYSAMYMGLKKTEKESVSEIEERLKKISKKTIFVGEAAVKYRDIIKKKLGKSAIFAPASLNYIRASDIAFQALGKIGKADKFSALTLEAQYLRPGVDPIRSPATNKMAGSSDVISGLTSNGASPVNKRK